MLRIIGGALRSRRLASPPDAVTRPSSGMLREALFNILQTRIDGARFLDLCAGSGAVGLEALSRGAAYCLFVESHPLAFKALRHNIDALGVADRAATLRHTLPKALDAIPTALPFDIAFADPPYEQAIALGIDCWQRLLQRGLLAADGIFVLEAAAALPPVLLPTDVHSESRRYGGSYLHLLRRQATADGVV